jgi:hypothetical protein
MPIEFPVRVPYTTAPNMVRNAGPVFAQKPRLDYIRQKQQELTRHGNDLWAELPGANNLIQQATRDLGLIQTSNIVNFALQIEEDIAVMHRGRLVAICFCFPSSWIPAERIGQELTRIHDPVADGDNLRRMSQRIAETMADPAQGSFRRHVWTIANSGELSQHPDCKNTSRPGTIDDLWFRLETQTTLPIGDNQSSLFFVRVETEPLSTIWSEATKRDTLLDSINSMTDAVLTYKNLHHIKEILNQKK